MTNFDTVRAITDNLQKVLEGRGIHFSRKVYDDERNIPAGVLPLGQIFYTGETFEYTHAQRPGYAETEFTIKVILNERDPVDAMREQQKWVHSIRDALTVNNLNVGDLSASKLVSRVTTIGVDTDNQRNYSVLLYRVSIRYREV